MFEFEGISPLTGKRRVDRKLAGKVYERERSGREVEWWKRGRKKEGMDKGRIKSTKRRQ